MDIALKNLSKHDLNRKNLRGLAESTGVYIFLDKNGRPIYIGKAKNLKRRISSYLSKNLGVKTAQLISETQNFSVLKVASELEALLLEARLVKTSQPKYNSQLRDDKHPLYIRITKVAYPQVVTARKVQEKEKKMAFFGPFPSSSNVKSVLRMLRRIFPYAQHKVGKRGCIYSQMGLCNPCPNEIEKLKSKKTKEELKKEYLQNIKYIKAVLSGRFTFVRESLEKLMRRYAKNENFEMAAIVRNQIEKLDYITQPVTSISLFLKNPNLLEDIRNEEIRELRRLISKYIKVPKALTRIECFDVAHLAGFQPTASMVTFIDGEPEKSLYRHFKVSLPAGKAGQKKGKDDISSLKEVAIRREKYLASWGLPDLIIVDGGKAQVSVFRRVFGKHKIPVICLAKREEKLVIPIKRHDLKTHAFIERKLPKGPAKNLVQRIRDEAHRFARRYHHKLLQKELIPSK